MTYKIRKGWHYALPLGFSLSTATGFGRKIRFDSSCVYELERNVGQINKLFGYAPSPFMHHSCSFRLGWRHNVGNPEHIEILAYWYDRGKMSSRHMMWVPIETDFYAHISAVGSLVVCSLFVDDSRKVTDQFPFSRKMDGAVKLLLRPYFGGKEPAPHDMTIRVDKAGLALG